MSNEAFAVLALVVMGSTVCYLGLRSERDPVTVVTAFIIFVFGLRRQWVVGPLGGVGTPAMLFGLCAAFLWFCAKSNTRVSLDRDPNPVRVALAVFSSYAVVSFAVAHTRPLTALEASGSYRELIWLASHVGLTLIICDGVLTRERLDTLLRRLVIAGAFLSILGTLAFFTGFDIAPALRVPGLSLNRELSGLGGRNIFNRPAGTAQHPIEYSVVLAMLLPFAIHYALYAKTKATRERAWLITGVLALGLPLAVSRSGIIVVAISLCVFALGFDWRRLLNGAALTLMFLVAMWGTVPGLLGTIRNLFLGWETDSSVQDRIERFPIVMEYVAERPWFGIGGGTYSVEEYPLLDNAYYGWMITHGLLGLVVLLSFFLVAISVAFLTRRLASDAETRSLALALAGALLGAAVTTGTFDSFHYRIFTGVLFVLIGCVGALWRMTMSRDRSSGTSNAQPMRV